MTKQESRAKIAEWKAELRSIARRYHIRLTSRPDDKSARRIAVLVGESFLRHFAASPEDPRLWQGIVNNAGYLQSDVYRSAREMHLSCAEIEEEERIRSMGAKGRGFDPLKLHPDTSEHNPEIMQFVFDNLLKHQEGAYHERTRQDQFSPSRTAVGRIGARPAVSIARITNRQ